MAALPRVSTRREPGLGTPALVVLALGAVAVASCQDSVSSRNADADRWRDAASADDASADAPLGLDAPDAPLASPDAFVTSDLCAAPSGSLIDGTFEGGLDGMVPRGGWQVRDPGYAAGCGGDHLSMVAAPPGCPGQALLLDARGSWDCYAIQAFADYGTIEGGRTYRISAVVRSEAQDNPAAWFVVGLQWLDGSDRVFGDEKNPRPADVNYDWTRIEWDLVAPADARRAVIWLSAHYPGRVTYDQVSIRAL